MFNILSAYIKIESDNPKKSKSLAHKINIQLCLFYSLLLISFCICTLDLILYKILLNECTNLYVMQYCSKLLFIQHILYPFNWCVYVVVLK